LENEDEHMETRTRLITRTKLRLALILMAGLMLLSGIALAQEPQKRLSVMTQMTKAERDQGRSGKVSEHEYDALVAGGEREKTAKSSGQSKAGFSASQAANIDFWFYTADVVLFNDHDNDGYFNGIDLLFDADTYFVAADVYAVVYLSFEGGPWNEYAVTDAFTIFGASSDDEYVIVTELVAGYPSGSYDLLIELFDANDDSFLAWFGPDDTSELAFLPLEDAERDTPVEVVPEVIVIRKHGGGAVGWLWLAMLGAAAVASRWRQDSAGRA
jgi:hypothetical protein